MNELYAGKIILKPSAVARLRIRDRYSLHRVVLDLYPRRTDGEGSAGCNRAVQWADRGEHLMGREILLLSTCPPKQDGLPDDVQVLVRQLPDSFWEHDVYRLQMDVNPSRSKEHERYAVPFREAERWLRAKSERSGFTFMQLQLGHYGSVRFQKASQLVTLAELRVDGVIRVLDRDLFRQTVTQGFGRGKAFGLGLMQVIPLHTF